MDHIDEWVSQEFETLAHVLYDYDEYLRLEMVPKEEWEHLIDKSKIFRVVDTKRNKIVLYASAVSSPQEILARVWSMDQEYNKVILNLDAQNAAAEALQMKKHTDELDAQKDFAMFVGKNTKSRWFHDGRVRDEEFRDLGPIKKHIV